MFPLSVSHATPPLFVLLALCPPQKKKRLPFLFLSLMRSPGARTFAASQFLKPRWLPVAEREKALKARRRTPDKVAHLPFEWDVKTGKSQHRGGQRAGPVAAL